MWFWGICEQTVKQTDRQIDEHRHTLITILRTATVGEIITYTVFSDKQWLIVSN